MARLQLTDDKLFLIPEKDRVLTEGILRTCIKSEAGFQFIDDREVFVLPAGKKIDDALEYVVGLLEDENIHYDLDDSCKRIMAQIHVHLNELKDSIERGKQLKKDKASKIEPPGFTMPLLENQQRAVNLHINMPFSADFSVPGSGKTWIAYATYSIFKSKGEVERLLIIGPIPSFQTWQEEYRLIFGKEPSSKEIRGSQRERIASYEKFDDHEIILMSYYNLDSDRQFIEQMLAKSSFMVILDESHNIKTPDAKRTDAVLALAPLCGRRMILSGTPIPRAVDDLYTQFTFLDPNMDILGDSGNFGGMLSEDESLSLLKNRISPFYYRIRKNDFRPRLPTPIFEKEFLEMETGRVYDMKHKLIGRVNSSPNQASIYYAIEGRIYDDIEKEERHQLSSAEVYEMKKWHKARIIRLLEVASNPALLMNLDEDMKVEKISSRGLPVFKKIEQYSQLGEVPVKIQRAEFLVRKFLNSDKDKKIIIWTSFVLNINDLYRRLAEFNPVKIYGAIAKNEEENRYLNRVGEIRRFKNDKNCRLLIANPASLAESISLHKNERGEFVCDTAIYLDRTFNGAHYMQSLDRIHRVGLKPNQKVRYILLQTEDSVDLDVDHSLTNKIDNMRQFLNDDIAKFSLETNYEDVVDGTSDQLDYQRVVDRLKRHAKQGKFD